jgi:CSLREA domain-containing protein
MLRSLVLGCALALLAAAPAHAAELVVNDLGDGAGSCPGVCTLRAAIAAANAGASYTAAEQTLINELKTDYTALLADVTALRTTVANLLTALKGVGKPMSPS